MRIRVREHYLIVAGLAVGQLSLVAITPVLTRSFVPQEFGYYLIAMAIGVVLVPLSTLKFEMVIPLARSGTRVRQFRRRSICAIVGVNVTLGLAALACLIAGATTLATVLAIVAIVNVTYSWMTIDSALLLRSQLIRRLAVRNALSGLMPALLQLVAAAVAPRALALAAALLGGRLIAIALTRGGPALLEPIGDGADSVAYGPARALTTVTEALLSFVIVHSLTFTSAAVLGSTQAAYVATAQYVSGAAMAVLGQGAYQAVQAASARVINSAERRLMQSIVDVGVRLVALAAVVGISIAVLGPLLAVPVLGSQWASVGTILPLLAAPAALQLVAGPLAPVFVMVGKERVILIQQVVRVVCSLGVAAAVAVVTRSLVATVAAHSAVATLALLSQILLTIACVRDFDACRAGGPVTVDRDDGALTRAV